MARLAGLWYGLEPVTPSEPAGPREMWLRKAMGSSAWGLCEKALAELRAKRKPFSFGRDELLLVRKTYLESADYIPRRTPNHNPTLRCWDTLSACRFLLYDR